MEETDAKIKYSVIAGQGKDQNPDSESRVAQPKRMKGKRKRPMAIFTAKLPEFGGYGNLKLHSEHRTLGKPE